ncbi:hypothetical protein H7H51_14835 [Mycolicibacterium farcinogenes]|nr:hypothetical protein [Mycolicibacterium farcinogenes]
MGPTAKVFRGSPAIPNSRGFPQQPGWPQHQGWPQQPGYPGGYPLKPPGPSGATAIFAGILAIPGGLVGIALGGVAIFAIFISSQEEREAWMYLTPLIGFGYGLSLVIGAVSLFRRKSIGRRLVVGGCAVLIVIGIVFVGGAITESHADFDSVGIPMIVGLVFPILTLVLAMLPSTARWIRAKQNVVVPPYYPPYPG